MKKMEKAAKTLIEGWLISSSKKQRRRTKDDHHKADLHRLSKGGCKPSLLYLTYLSQSFSFCSSRRQTANSRFLTNVVRGVQSHNRAVLSIPPSGEIEHRRRDEYELRWSFRRSDDAKHREGESSDQGRMGRMRGWSDEEDEMRRREGNSTSRRDETSERRSHRKHNSSRDSKEQSDYKARHRDRDSEQDRNRRKRSRSPRRHKTSDWGTSKSEELPPSKMDRYFDEKYDPVLDVRAETREDENGLIEDDGWDRMLRALKDKEERKRAKKENRKEDKVHRDEKPRVGTDVMKIQYTSRGKQREWDKGKDFSS
jgi:hypothetical protein